MAFESPNTSRVGQNNLACPAVIRNPKNLNLENISEYMVITGEHNDLDTLREFSSNPNNHQNYQSLKLSAINAAHSSIDSVKDYEKLLFRDKDYKEF